MDTRILWFCAGILATVVGLGLTVAAIGLRLVILEYFRTENWTAGSEQLELPEEDQDEVGRV